MAFGKILLVLFLSNMLLSAKSQSGCPCHDPNSGARWDRKVSRGVVPCKGICDQAFRNETWLCNNTNNVQLVCHSRLMPCVQPETCQGEWTKWAQTGPCSVTCGLGVKPQTRSCYRRKENSGESRNILNRYCLGSKGNKSQERNSSCRRLRCPNTTPMLEPFDNITTLAPSKTKTPEIVRSAVTTSQHSADKVSITSTSALQAITERTAPIQIEPLTLAVVLGSIGLICVAVVIVSLIVVRRRRSSHPRHSSILSTSPYVNRKPGDELNDYEIVAPNFVHRQANANRRLRQMNQFSAANALYNQNRETNGQSNRESNAPSRNAMSLRLDRNNSSGIYLEPYHSSTTQTLPTRESMRSEEGIYMTIDDYEK